MAGLTDTQELLLVILIVIIFKSIFLACLCKIRKCSEIERNYSMTPRAMCRNLCRKPSDTPQTRAVPSRNTTASNDNKPLPPPPPYCAPPQYEDVVTSPEWYPDPPPYTICITEHELASVSSDVTSNNLPM